MYRPIFNTRTALIFTHFTRKSYALFNCLGKEVLIGTLSVATLTHAKADGIAKRGVIEKDSLRQKEVKLGEVVVNGAWAPLAEQKPAMIVSVTTADDIQRAAAESINDVLKSATGVDVRQRGGFGVQTDISINGGTFDQTVILLNGIDIRKYRYDEYMDIFSVVFQDFKLFALPLGQNVATAQHYDVARAADCLQKAGFSDRLARMPKGLDTCLYKDLDEDGVTISGGEAQKIAIARALYKDAPFIVLDEPTAALDPVAEAEIYAKFNEIAGDKTAIYISHRLSSCKFCDEIAVFDHGEVVQQGTHEELLGEPDGKYYELWNAQAQYYTEESA